VKEKQYEYETSGYVYYGITTYQYDGKKRLIKKTVENNGEATKEYKYDYDINDSIISYKYYTPIGQLYDSSNYKYISNPNGTLSKAKGHYIINNDFVVDKIISVYTLNSSLKVIEKVGNANGYDNDKKEYEYNGSLLIKEKFYYNKNDVSPSGVALYFYDSKNRVIKKTSEFEMIKELDYYYCN
jgi:hypothetical protein